MLIEYQFTFYTVECTLQMFVPLFIKIQVLLTLQIEYGKQYCGTCIYYVSIWQECDPLRKGDLKFIKGYNIIQILQYLISIFSLLCYLATPLHRPLTTKGALPVVYRTLLEVHTQKIILTSWQIVAYKRTSLTVMVHKLPCT